MGYMPTGSVLVIYLQLDTEMNKKTPSLINLAHCHNKVNGVRPVRVCQNNYKSNYLAMKFYMP